MERLCVLYGRDPTYDHLRVFGSLCYAHKQGRLGDIFDSRSGCCIFVGYPYGEKGWCLYDLETHEFFVTRDVKLYETEFSFVYLPNDDLVLPSNFGHPSVDLEDCDDLGVTGGAGRQVDHVEPSVETAQPPNSEALSIQNIAL